MAVYVDDAIWARHGRKWCHLLADVTDELHRFAALLGIKQASYQGPPKTSVPHYDLTAYERRRAITLGAVSCNRAEIVAVMHRLRANNDPREEGNDHAQSLGPQHLVQRAEGDVGDRRTRPRL
jgi:hypothetical protein